ncbi:Undecaprenyl-phosphate 4-deoxy-4-formamido-L-arabinose transferase [Gossypium arboreum]|uniref:Undecaprenyl-phosphate 4-deoxy-4-formamido-L-arabinose transferase n=1 Tax=Gossypium arboreum TaxID=29729 RepID=A0A0B0NAP8_GOSAR|nr:Undecaprenyl-phosphate 4-deoxy-4-formamido-L-arabinose transferase [Gossypium arboreum]
MDQHEKSTRPRLPHTGSPHGRLHLAELKHDLQTCHTGVSLSSPSIVLFRKGHF